MGFTLPEQRITDENGQEVQYYPPDQTAPVQQSRTLTKEEVSGFSQLVQVAEIRWGKLKNGTDVLNIIGFKKAPKADNPQYQKKDDEFNFSLFGELADNAHQGITEGMIVRFYGRISGAFNDHSGNRYYNPRLVVEGWEIP